MLLYAWLLLSRYFLLLLVCAFLCLLQFLSEFLQNTTYSFSRHRWGLRRRFLCLDLSFKLGRVFLFRFILPLQAIRITATAVIIS